MQRKSEYRFLASCGNRLNCKQQHCLIHDVNVMATSYETGKD